MEEKLIASGRCEFRLVECTSKKTGNPYKCIKIKFGDYEFPSILFVNSDQMYILQEKMKKPV